MKNHKILETGKCRFVSLMTAFTLVACEMGGMVAMPMNALAAAEEETVAEEAVEGLYADATVTDDVIISEDTSAGEALEEEIFGESTPESDVVDADNNIFGDQDVNKDQYYVTFTVNNDGKQKTWTKELTQDTKQPLNDYEFYNELFEEINAFVNESDSMTRLVGWSVYTDGFNMTTMSEFSAYTYSIYQNGYNYYGSDSPVYLNSDGYTYDVDSQWEYDEDLGEYVEVGGKKTFSLSGNKDYHFVAHTAKAAAECMYVSAIPSVYYNGLQHVAIGSKTSPKKQVADLRIKVYQGYEDNMWITLKPGKDYTLTYKNNTDASMKLVREGESGEAGTYVKNYSDNSKRPTVTVIGKGTYKGFSADVYYDILPLNIGEHEYDNAFLDPTDESPYDSLDGWSSYNVPVTYIYSATPDIVAYKSSYTMKNGTVTGMPKQKITKRIRTYGSLYDAKSNNNVTVTTTLTEGKDYKVEIYKWNDAESKWDDTKVTNPANIKEQGDYLYLIRGINNYCGAYYGREYMTNSSSDGAKGNDFNKGGNGYDANPVHFIDNSNQFRVTDNNNYDISFGKLTIGKKALNYSGKAYGANDFGISIKDKSGKALELGKDYTVEFSGENVKIGNSYYARNRVLGETYGSEVKASDSYSIRITGAGNYYGSLSKSSAVKINGLKLKGNFFALKDKKVPYGSAPVWTITAAGTAQKLSRESGNEYYVGSYHTWSKKKGTLNIGGGPSRCGYGIDPASAAKLSYTVVPYDLNTIVKNGWVKFEVADSGKFNINGAVPEWIVVTNSSGAENYYNYLFDGCYGSAYVSEINTTISFKFSFSNNKAVDNMATVKVSSTSFAANGSADVGKYKVETLPVEEFSDSWEVNNVKVEIVDAIASKGSLSNPTVNLYQMYIDNTGRHVWGKVPANYFKAEKGDVLGSKNLACEVIVRNGATKGFDFGDGIKPYEVFGLYEVQAKDIKSVTINGVDYSVTKGVIDSKYAPVFEGDSIWPYISKITMADGKTELLINDDFYREVNDGTNITAGKKTGTVYIKFHYNRSEDRYPYGGTVALKFDISDHAKINM